MTPCSVPPMPVCSWEAWPRSQPYLIKDKFFAYPQLLGFDKVAWQRVFAGGDFAIFRLTPDEYHYNHLPVSGKVVDFCHLDGLHHSCHPEAVMAVATPYSSNERVVTIIDSDVPGGSGVGLVAMIEVTALMIGRVEQCYGGEGYADPRPVEAGDASCGGAAPEVSVPAGEQAPIILLFEPRRIEVCPRTCCKPGRAPERAASIALDGASGLTED
ncbi:MAG: phosphatidylserine decarboxylase [Desulfurivibrio sp.]|nr:phosphatidylserine decarboxylase [Desulfurivibrio sp.]